MDRNQILCIASEGKQRGKGHSKRSIYILFGTKDNEKIPCLYNLKFKFIFKVLSDGRPIIATVCGVFAIVLFSVRKVFLFWEKNLMQCLETAG